MDKADLLATLLSGIIGFGLFAWITYPNRGPCCRRSRLFMHHWSNWETVPKENSYGIGDNERRCECCGFRQTKPTR